MAINRLRFHNILVQDMGAPSRSATELAELVDEGIEASTDTLVTEHAFREEMSSFRVEMASFRAEMMAEINRLLKWLMVAGVTIGGSIIALLIALLVRGQ